MKVAMDERMSGEELLRLAGGFEPLHLAFSSSGRAMGVLRAVVEVSALPVLDIGQQMALSYPIASELVGDDHPGHILQALQQTPEEPLGGFRIPSVLHKDIEDREWKNSGLTGTGRGRSLLPAAWEGRHGMGGEARVQKRLGRRRDD